MIQYTSNSESLNHAVCASLQPFITVEGEFPDYLGILSAVSLRSAFGIYFFYTFVL